MAWNPQSMQPGRQGPHHLLLVHDLLSLLDHPQLLRYLIMGEEDGLGSVRERDLYLFHFIQVSILLPRPHWIDPDPMLQIQ
jgi:hypothetical protein